VAPQPEPDDGGVAPRHEPYPGGVASHPEPAEFDAPTQTLTQLQRELDLTRARVTELETTAGTMREIIVLQLGLMNVDPAGSDSGSESAWFSPALDDVDSASDDEAPLRVHPKPESSVAEANSAGDAAVVPRAHKRPDRPESVPEILPAYGGGARKSRVSRGQGPCLAAVVPRAHKRPDRPESVPEVLPAYGGGARKSRNNPRPPRGPGVGARVTTESGDGSGSSSLHCNAEACVARPDDVHATGLLTSRRRLKSPYGLKQCVRAPAAPSVGTVIGGGLSEIASSTAGGGPASGMDAQSG
jgi:hypothetical protein